MKNEGVNISVLQSNIKFSNSKDNSYLYSFDSSDKTHKITFPAAA